MDYAKQIAEAVLSEVLDQIGHIRCDDSNSTRVEKYLSVDLDAVIASVPRPEPVACDEIEQIAKGRYKVVPSDQSMFWRFSVVAGDGTQQLYIGREMECRAMADKFTGAFLDGAFMHQKLSDTVSAEPVNARLLNAAKRVADGSWTEENAIERIFSYSDYVLLVEAIAVAEVQQSKQEPVKLTDERIAEIANACGIYTRLEFLGVTGEFARAIERELKGGVE